MKAFLSISIAILLYTSNTLGQNRAFIHPSTFEVQFSLSDYKSKSIFASPKNMYGGLGLAFTKGISNHFDWRISVNGTFADSITKNKPATNDKSLLLQADVSIRGRMFGEPKTVQPYLLAGFGVSSYKTDIGLYMPAGAGLQVSLFKDAYLLINSQYRIGITNTLNNHFYYSVGFAGTIGKRKPVTAPKKQVPPPVMAVVVRDRDNDGLVDTADACPDQAGLAKFNGCPDTDNDGIQDKDDKCVTVPGVKENAGCPLPKKEETQAIKEKIDLAARQIYFRTGSAELLPTSYASLNEVVKVLAENPTITLIIEGHTDNVGTPSDNRVLSERRALSVMQYLTTHGIQETRLKAKGFGQEQPIADNSTEEGRAKNRRVVLQLSF